MTFAENELHLALHVLNTYGGEQSDRVHKAVIKLSNGDLHLLACWAGGATQQDVETLLWFAGATKPGTAGKTDLWRSVDEQLLRREPPRITG